MSAAAAVDPSVMGGGAGGMSLSQVYAQGPPPPRIPPDAVVLSEKDPIAYYIDDFLTEAEIEHITATATPQLDRARVSDTAASQGTQLAALPRRPSQSQAAGFQCSAATVHLFPECAPGHGGRATPAASRPTTECPASPLAAGSKKPGGVSGTRTNKVAWLAGVGDPVLEALEDRICDVVQWRAECMEEFQVIHYEKSQEYRPHYDAYDTSGDHGQVPGAPCCCLELPVCVCVCVQPACLPACLAARRDVHALAAATGPSAPIVPFLSGGLGWGRCRA
jgi:hypothetical protein